MIYTPSGARALFFLLAAFVHGAGAGQGANYETSRVKAIAKLHEDSEVFEHSAASLDAAGWAEFIATSKHSAHSEHDKQRQVDLDDAIREARSYDITIQDYFDDKVAENDGSPRLRDLAKELKKGIVKGPVHVAQKAEAVQRSQKVSEVIQNEDHQQKLKPGIGLRSLLMNAGHHQP